MADGRSWSFRLLAEPMNPLNNIKMQLTRIWIIASLGVFLACSFTTGHAETGDSAINQLSFRRDVRPIISNHCFACHGPDEQQREADVRLDVADEVDLEELLARITSTDPDVMMPPPEMNKPLKPEQVTTLTRWIDQGAPLRTALGVRAPTRSRTSASKNRKLERSSDRPLRVGEVGRREDATKPAGQQANADSPSHV